MLTRTV
ncbi:Protein of unknown function [Bacillus mobilis]|nr:Protein of unknown function [Bacillus mobilis]